MKMNNKIIIHNYTNLDDLEVLDYIERIIMEGKVSENKHGKLYCFAMRIGNITITCDRVKNTYTFKIWEE